MNNKNLINMKANQTGTIFNIGSGCSARKRLLELGLNKGTRVTVMKNDYGPIIINAHGSKLALGRGLARDVIINAID